MILHTVAKVLLFGVKVKECFGSTSTVFLDPYFFEKATTGFVICFVTTCRYTNMLQNFVIPELLQ